MTKDEALKLALEAMLIKQQVTLWENDEDGNKFRKAITAIKEALAQPAQEPDDLTIAYMSGLHDGKKRERALWELTKLGQEIEAQPTKRQWVGLTDVERDAIEAATLDLHGVPKFFATAIEAKLRSKNT
jgi:restriction endonuclease Mrr